MDTPLKVSNTYIGQIKYAILLPVFFFVFCFVYDPFSFRELYQIGGKSFYFHLVMLTLIMFGSFALTRLIFVLLYKKFTWLWWHYIVWCVNEVLVIAAFFALYTTLFLAKSNPLPYFEALTFCIKLVGSILVYPYLFSILLRIISNKKADIESLKEFPSETLFKFYDEHKRLKLTISPTAIVFISAEANYVCIHYLENEKIKDFFLRSSMKSIESDAAKHGLVRCHRSYYVNPRHIKVLSRGKEGMISVEFVHDGLSAIPVSKLYYDNLSSLL